MSENITATDPRILDIMRKIDEFKAEILEGTTKNDSFIKFHEIERRLTNLRYSTDKIYLDIVSDILKSLDETDLIRKKKENSEKLG